MVLSRDLTLSVQLSTGPADVLVTKRARISAVARFSKDNFDYRYVRLRASIREVVRHFTTRSHDVLKQEIVKISLIHVLWNLTATVEGTVKFQRDQTLCWLSGKLWYMFLQHSCVGNTIVYCLLQWLREQRPWGGFQLLAWDHGINSLAPGRCSCNLEMVIFKVISKTDFLSISCEIIFKQCQVFTDD